MEKGSGDVDGASTSHKSAVSVTRGLPARYRGKHAHGTTTRQQFASAAAWCSPCGAWNWLRSWHASWDSNGARSVCLTPRQPSCKQEAPGARKALHARASIVHNENRRP